MRVVAISLACVFVAALLLAGCERSRDSTSIETLAGGSVKRVNDPAQLALGRQVYQANCATCHGENAEGAPNWRQPGPDGRYPPPPLNGSGHDWHHPTAVLIHLIKNGSPGGQGNMPAWGGKLSDEEIRAVIAWFQSLWPDPVYGAWYDMQQRSPSQ